MRSGGAGRALITGASAGVGRELVRAFAARGFDVVLLSRDGDRLCAVAREVIAAYGVDASVLPADLSDPRTAQGVFDALEGDGVEIDVLVNNAGVQVEGDFVDIPIDEQWRLLQINVVALTAMTHLFAAAMRRRRRGRILNVASIAAFLPVPRLAIYAASKAFVLSLSEALSEELAGAGVSVTALCPGLTDTAMLRGSRLAEALPEALVMSAADVAEAGCAACLRGEPVIVPGAGNRALAAASQLAPRALVRSLGGVINVSRWGRLGRALLKRPRRVSPARPRIT